MAGGNIAGFAGAVLKGIGAPVNHANVAAIAGWAQAEGGLPHNNPLNTTEGEPGASTFNGVGVKGYSNLGVGAQATIATLRNGRYGEIINAFKASNPGAVASAIGSSPWGTSGQLVSQTIHSALGQNYNLGSASNGNVGGSGGNGKTTVSLPGTSMDTVKNVENQGAFNQAEKAFKLGSYLKSVGEGSGSDMGSLDSPAGAKGLGGISSGENPLFASGVASSTAPNPSDYMTAQTVLQKIAGKSVTLATHPGGDAGAQTAETAANQGKAAGTGLDKVVNLAIRAVNLEKQKGVYTYTQSAGGPGQSRTNVGAGVLSQVNGSKISYDCSGFIGALYKFAGLPSPYGSAGYGGVSGDANSGGAMSQVSAGQAQPGDVVTFGPGGSEHIALYIGNGKVVNMGAQGQPFINTVAAEIAGHGGSFGGYWHLKSA